MNPPHDPDDSSGGVPATEPAAAAHPMPPMPPLRLMEGGTIVRRRERDGGYAWAERPDPALRAQVGAAALRRVVGGGTVVDMTSVAFTNSALWAEHEPRTRDRWQPLRRRVPLLLALLAIASVAALLARASR